MNRKTLVHALLLLGFMSLTLAGTCINIDNVPICLSGNKCTIDAPVVSGDTVKMILHLREELGDFDFLADTPDTFYRCTDQDLDIYYWENPAPGVPPRCGGPSSDDTIFVGKTALLKDLNDFLFDRSPGQRAGPITDILPADTCKCDEAIFLMRAVVDPNVNINNGIAKGTSKTRGNNTGAILEAGFNYAISLQPIIENKLDTLRPENFPGNCAYPFKGSLSGLQNEMISSEGCRPVTVSPFVSAPGRTVKVAIVDTGADPNYSYTDTGMGGAVLNKAFSVSTEMNASAIRMAGYVAYGEAWPGDTVDENGNCFIDDYFGYDFLHDDNSPADKNGHGTHMAYTVLTADNEVDHDIRVLPLQFGGYDEDGGFGCDLFSGICAISYARAEKADIINLSWGFYSDIFPDVLYEQIRRATTEDILIVTSAGNDSIMVDSDACAHWPSGFSRVAKVDQAVISVAALGVFDPVGPFELASYSNYGQKIDLAAPGTDINGALAGSGSGMIRLDGTSMAAAVVSRRAAMLRRNNRSRDSVPAAQLKLTILQETIQMESGCIEGRRALDISKDQSLMEAIGYQP